MNLQAAILAEHSKEHALLPRSVSMLSFCSAVGRCVPEDYHLYPKSFVNGNL